MLPMRVTFPPDILLPAIVQDADTHAVLMLGYMNAEAYQRTLETGWVTFFSRSRQRLWVKGETSGHRLRLVEVRWDCDGDALLVLAQPEGPICHRGTYSCFGEQGELLGDFLGHLTRIIRERLTAAPDASYTARLAAEGLPRVAQKVGEEAVETLVAALAQSPERLTEEAADLLYHLWLLLLMGGTSPEALQKVLRERHERRS
jgi:phosphoribosyl-ATP pyrophosphohydrolase/phosphoribosyl-AMP cyclohydrolase